MKCKKIEFKKRQKTGRKKKIRARRDKLQKGRKMK